LKPSIDHFRQHGVLLKVANDCCLHAYMKGK